MRKLLVGVLLVLVSVGCSDVKKNRELNKESAGKTVVGWYYYYATEGDYENILQYLDEDFLKNTPKDVLIAKLKEQKEKLGTITETKLLEWKNTGKDDKKNKTKEYEFKYEVKYSGGETKTEDFILLEKDYDMKIHEIK